MNCELDSESESSEVKNTDKHEVLLAAEVQGMQVNMGNVVHAQRALLDRLNKMIAESEAIDLDVHALDPFTNKMVLARSRVDAVGNLLGDVQRRVSRMQKSLDKIS